MRRTFSYRLYPTCAQNEALLRTLDLCRELYNSALEERRTAHAHGARVGLYSQQSQLPAIKDARPEYRELDAQMLQEVLTRVDRAFQGFFRRVRQGHKGGYPRFRSRERYDSFTFRRQGWKISGNRLDLRGIGTLKVRWSRPLEGTVKTVTVRRDGDEWYVCFSCVLERSRPATPDRPPLGVDVGLEHFATLSTGEHVANPRHLRHGAALLAQRQQALARKKRGSRRRTKAKRLVHRAYRKVRRQRLDFHHKTANSLVARAGGLAVERLRIANMMHNHALAKSISDVGWAQFLAMLEWKAEDAAIPFIVVDPAGTSQTCSRCGVVVRKDLSQRWHTCACGVSLQRDHNAALNILYRAGLARQVPVGT